jgi:two-component system response regulator
VSQAKILLVEDNQDDIALTMRAFNSHNIRNEVIVVNDGVQALEYLFGTDGNPPGELPSIVLLDLNLPKVNGLEVLQRIRASARTRTLPVVILTSSTDQSDLMRGYEHGANSYVRKPVDFVEFTEAAKQLGLYWLLLNQSPVSPDGL